MCLKGTGITKIDAQTANGQITLEGSDRDEVSVRAWKKVRGRRGVAAEFAEQVEIRAEQIGDELRIFTDHPPPPQGVNLSVRYAIETPREVDVNLRTVNSRIKIGGISGAIDATTVNGVINLEGDAGPIRARATNGSVKAEIGLLTERCGVFDDQRHDRGGGTPLRWFYGCVVDQRFHRFNASCGFCRAARRRNAAGTCAF